MSTAALLNRSPRGRRHREKRFGRWIVALLLVLGAFAASTASADLLFFDRNAGPGLVRILPGPISNVLFDIAFMPSSAEGGGVYGFSEARFVATGDLEFDATGFRCAATACLHFPLPFVTGKEIVVTGGEDLLGEFSGTSDVMSISVSGSTGLILMMEADYVDATGATMAPGAIRSADLSLIGLVPEPGMATGLVVGTLGVAALARRRRD